MTTKIEFTGETKIHWKNNVDGNYSLRIASGKPTWGGERWLSLDTTEFYNHKDLSSGKWVGAEKRTMLSLKGDDIKKLRDYLNSLDI